MKTIRSLILFSAALLLGGCISGGTRVDLAEVDKIQPGVTLIADLESKFGKPWSAKKQDDGSTKYVWQYTKMAFAVGVTEQRVLTVFAEGGKVKDYTVKDK
ncbi:MAG: hypothetical protein H7067_07660 [Burkholderiales bacterium]|nr:hypothetical protein [Opitutaceae bacterium]